MIECGEKVVTRSGEGEVVLVNHIDNLVEVKLDGGGEILRVGMEMFRTVPSPDFYRDPNYVADATAIRFAPRKARHTQ